jgi:superfamily II DNA helicase RecQ
VPPRVAASSGPLEGALSLLEEAHYEKLREWRLGQAEGKPAFTVAANTVLEEVLRRRPRSTGELIEIRGIGPAFCEKHGESLLAALTRL